MIDRKTLARLLDGRKVADWTVFERDQELGVADDATATRRAEQRTRWQLVVHADTPAGRGTARVTIDAVEGDPERVVDQAIAFAEASVGRAWATIPQAAPARVELADPALLGGDPLAAAETIVKTIARPPGATVTARATVLREHVQVSARQGFHTEWQATLVQAEALVIAGVRSLSVTREARRRDGLELDAAIVEALADLQLLATAGKPAPGPCALVLGPDALVHGGLGVWAAFASQADAVVARQGLTRYHERAPIAAGAELVPEPLSITSNGALPYGLYSAPLGDDGDAVRRFVIVDRGIAAGLGLGPREAALRHREPNGGVRNLVVERGSWAEQLDDTGRTLEIRRLRDLSIDPYTGDASLEIALAIDHHGPTATPVAGGTVRLDLIDALARARRSQNRLRRGGYDGPRAVRIERADLIS